MKLKLDENLPTGLAIALRGLGHDVDTVVDESLVGAQDDRVWSACLAEERLLITQDLVSQTFAGSPWEAMLASWLCGSGAQDGTHC